MKTETEKTHLIAKILGWIELYEFTKEDIKSLILNLEQYDEEI